MGSLCKGFEDLIIILSNLDMIIDTENLTKSWLPPESDLDDQQRAVLDRLVRWLHSEGSEEAHWIRGFAGSGKTILLVHAMRQAIKHKPDKRICFVTYTFALRDLVATSGDDFQTDLPTPFSVFTFEDLSETAKQGEIFDFVFADEIQDARPEHLKLLKNKAKKVVIAGDPNQSIYKNRVPAEGIQRDLSIDALNKYNLNVLHRLPEKILDIAKIILPKTQDIHTELGQTEPGHAELTQYGSETEEDHQVYERAKNSSEPRKPSVILLPNHKAIYRFASNVCNYFNKPTPPWPTWMNGMRDYRDFNAHLANHEITMMFFGSDNGDLRISNKQKQTYLMTYHSAKGLDFNTVFIPGLNADLKIWKDNEEIARTLLFVAITRTRNYLYLSFNSEEHHPYLEETPLKINIYRDQTSNEEDEDDDMPF